MDTEKYIQLEDDYAQLILEYIASLLEHKYGLSAEWSADGYYSLTIHGFMDIPNRTINFTLEELLTTIPKLKAYNIARETWAKRPVVEDQFELIDEKES